jgi:hypothetical protein
MSARPVRLAWDDVEMGHPCGPAAQISLTLERDCTLTVAANREPARRTSVDRTTCDRLFEMATHAGHPNGDSCPVAQSFAAGATITIGPMRERYVCFGEPLGSQLAELATRLAPDWRDGRGMSQQCDFTDPK